MPVHVLNIYSTNTSNSLKQQHTSNNIQATTYKQQQTKQNRQKYTHYRNLHQQHQHKHNEIEQLAHTTQPNIITVQETKLTTISKTPNISTCTPSFTKGVGKLGGRLVTYIKHNKTLAQLNISTNIKQKQYRTTYGQYPHQQTKTDHNLCITPQDASSPHYTTLDTKITNCIQHIIYTQDPILTSIVNVYFTLWYSYTVNVHHFNHKHQFQTSQIKIPTRKQTQSNSLMKMNLL